MTKQTKELETLWWDWLATSERLTRTLHEQTVALTLRQVERVERLQPEMDALMQRMAEIDDLAVAAAQKLAGELGSQPNLRSLVAALEKADAQQVQALANRVIVAGHNVHEIIAKNKALIENELQYVNGTVALIVKEGIDSQSSYKGRPRQASLMLDHAA